MAKMLVDNLASGWDPSKYTDEYRNNLLKLIKARMKGERPKFEEAAEPVKGEVVDLMERLRRSLETARRGPGPPKPVAKAGHGAPKPVAKAGARKPAGKKPGRAA